MEVSQEIGIAESTVRRIFDEHAREPKASVTFETPEKLGIDEVTIRPTPRLILTNIGGRELEVQARRYASKLYDRQRTGKKIVATVVGNHGTYTVSLAVKPKRVESACSCYVGRGGSCHHCEALAQTFLNEAESFKVIRRKGRGSMRTLKDLKAYLNGATLDTLLT